VTPNFQARSLIAVGLLAVFVVSPVASAEGFWSQFIDPDDGRFDASRFLADNAYGFLPVPIIITDPAVDGGLGAVGAYTGNDSWFVGGGHMGFFKEGRIRYMGGGGYGDVNLDFFGFGEIELTRPIELNTEAAALIQSVKFKVGKLPLFVGPVQRFVSARIAPNSLGDLSGDLLPPALQEKWQELVTRLLTQDVVTSGLGVTIEFDSRDNFFSPHAGYQYQLEHLWYRDFFGSDIDYQLTSFNGHNYWNVTDRIRTALRVSVESADTEGLLPPFATPGIVLRGVPALRYQGNFVAVTEAEVTWQIDSRWAVLAFAGAGRAANSSGELGDAPSRVTKGAGFRYLIAKRYGFEMGLDIARGPEENIFYIQAGTAW